MVDTGIIRRSDDWERRCRFNTARLAERAAENEFDLEPADSLHLATTPGLPPGTLAQTWYYIDRRTQLHVARVHVHYLPTGQPDPKRGPDPKMVRIGDFIYVKHRGPQQRNDPALKWPYDSPERKSYIRFRRWACQKVGPEFDAFIASWEYVAFVGAWCFRRFDS